MEHLDIKDNYISGSLCCSAPLILSHASPLLSIMNKLVRLRYMEVGTDRNLPAASAAQKTVLSSVPWYLSMGKWEFVVTKVYRYELKPTIMPTYKAKRRKRNMRMSTLSIYDSQMCSFAKEFKNIRIL